MAQIVTITNPLTGQPAQVDQLDHTAQQIDDAIARAIPGGAIDIALQNNDSRNWGLGAYAKNTSDLDSITDTGWYVGAPLVDGDNTLGNSIILHLQYENSKNATQIAYTNNAGSWDRNIILIREKNNNVWSPWEWLNPPMRFGIEYRTTERHNGGTVFAKAMTYTLTSAYDIASQFELEIPHGISNFGSLVRAEAVSPPYMIPYVSKNGGFAGVRAVNATNILFDSYKTSWSSGDKITFKLFYTKS